ncbi:MAG: UDP-N-acetylglucosamine--N-acetylmuramyl-(pentapeptide) pyrophosphoryl-undecaprenol N-acetylglucosamine transferase [bacterium]
MYRNLSGIKPNILISAGGTGGHIMPAVTIGSQMEYFRPLYICGVRDIEKTIYRDMGIEPFTVNMKNLRPASIPALISGIIKAVSLIISRNIASILMMGSYAGLPAGIAGLLTNTPVFLMEQDIIPGRTIKLFSFFSHIVFTGFNSKYRLPGRAKCVFTGHPIPERSEPRNFRPEHFFDNTRKTILLTGGSQGALDMYRRVIDALTEIGRYNIILLAGNYRSSFSDSDNMKVLGFRNDMGRFYASADIIISRAGALSIAEIINTGKPSILIPLPRSAGSHQLKNARYAADAYREIMVIEEHRVNTATLEKTLDSLPSGTERRQQVNTANIIERTIMECLRM